MKAPDIKKHLQISLVKSFLRIASCLVSLFIGNIYPLAIGFICAEILGVIEEL